MKIGQIYVLICPIDNSVRYVGQTTNTLNRRISKHKSDTRLYLKKNYKLNYKNCWIFSLMKINVVNDLKIQLVEEIFAENINDGFDKMDEREIYWIKYYKELGCRLTNISPGGKLDNIKHSHKMRKILEVNEARKERPKVTLETKQKISIANSGSKNGMYGRRCKRTTDQIKKLQKSLINSDVLKKSRNSDEYKKKISDIVSIPVLVLNDEFDIILEFKNSTECAKHFGFTRGNIKNAIRGLRKIGKSMNNKYWVIRKEDYIESIRKIKAKISN